MSEYKVTKGPRGRQLFFRDGKMISKKDIPEDILATMELQKPVSDEAPEFRKCVMCDGPGTDERTLNSQRVYLCFNCYQERTTGEIVQKMRELTAV